MSETTIVRSAEELRTRNAAADGELLVFADSLHELGAGSGEAWSAAQVLAHVEEFSRFFGAQLATWLVDRSVVVGRTMEHPVRLAAVSPADLSRRTIDELRSSLRASLEQLAGVVGELRDADLEGRTMNAKYGDEPLTSFLDRYVVGHKEAHVRQLRELEGATP